MKKLIHYILIAIMFNWNIAVFAETDQGCSNWEVVEETDTYIMENCMGGDNFSARIRTKMPEGIDIEVVEAPEKSKENPIKKFKDKVEEAPKATAKVEKLEKIDVYKGYKNMNDMKGKIEGVYMSKHFCNTDLEDKDTTNKEAKRILRHPFLYVSSNGAKRWLFWPESGYMGCWDSFVYHSYGISAFQSSK